MNVFQQALYLLSFMGVLSLLRSKTKAVDLALPLILLGGVMYHLLFEAKSQYSFMCVLLLIPVATQGLSLLEKAISALRGKMRRTLS